MRDIKKKINISRYLINEIDIGMKINNILSNESFLKNNIIEMLVKQLINPLSSPCSGAPALKYGDVNIVTPSLGEVKGLIKKILIIILKQMAKNN